MKLTRCQYDRKMQAEVERLIVEGRIPSFDKVLAAVEQTCKKYRQRILDARKRVRGYPKI